jgi:hypothetical protein
MRTEVRRLLRELQLKPSAFLAALLEEIARDLRARRPGRAGYGGGFPPSQRLVPGSTFPYDPRRG